MVEGDLTVHVTKEMTPDGEHGHQNHDRTESRGCRGLDYQGGCLGQIGKHGPLAVANPAEALALIMGWSENPLRKFCTYLPT